MNDRKQLYSMLADFYEFTMGNGFFENGYVDQIGYFDLYFRRIPDKGGYVIYAGLEQVIENIESLEFTTEDIEYLKNQKIFSDGFLEYLENFKFECDIWSFNEGEVVYPNEPLIIARGPIIQLLLLETMMLVTVNHQSLIATKTSRMVNKASGRDIMEFGARRAQGYSATYYGARAAYIGGCVGTSNTLAAKDFDVKPMGTMAHAWVQFFETEYEAFKTYAKTYPDSCSLLIDTYDTLESGVINAIKVFDEIVVPQGYRPKSVRLDSGDIAYLSKEVRKKLDEAGYEDVKIIASNSLDEYIIDSLIQQGAKIDIFGIGERLITAKSDPILGCVYKLVAVEDDKGNIIPRIKKSENVEKVTTPGFKQAYRFFDKDSNKSMADLITLHDENYINTNEIEIFHPVHTWKTKKLSNYNVEKMLLPIYEGGKLVYDRPSLEQIRQRSLESVSRLWEEQKRLENPHKYIVDLSYDLWNLKNELLKD